MKRIIAILLAVICAVSVSVTASAVEEQFVDSSQGSYFAETDIQCKVYSTYLVTVPTNIDVRNTGQVTVNMDDVADGYQVEAYLCNLDANGCIPLYADKDNYDTVNGKVQLTVDGEYCEYDEYGKIYTFDKTNADQSGDVSFNLGFVVYQPVGAGTYEGVVCFRFDCTDC